MQFSINAKASALTVVAGNGAVVEAVAVVAVLVAVVTAALVALPSAWEALPFLSVWLLPLDQ